MYELILNLWALLQVAAPASVIKAGITFVSILALRLLRVLPSSKWARAANVIFSILLSGATVSSVSAEEVLVFTMTSAFSAFVWEVCTRSYQYIKDGKKPFELPALK